MKNTLKILVIEDNSEHIADAKKMFAEMSAKVSVKLEIAYVEDYATAMKHIESVDCVLTDVFFPLFLGGDELPYGKQIVEYCLKAKKAVVWITSTYHHGSKTDPLNEWGRRHGLEMYDCYDYTLGSEAKCKHKPWKKALLGLVCLIECLETGTFFFEYKHDEVYLRVKDSHLLYGYGPPNTSAEEHSLSLLGFCN